MRYFLSVFIVCLICIKSHSQFAELEIVNPAPRVGEDINVSYSLILIEEIGKGTFTLKDYNDETGKVTIGPFEFVVDGVTFKSDSLSLTVFPKLPNEKDGFWVRYFEYKGEYYLITEQRFSGVWKSKKEDQNSVSFSFETGDVIFAEISDSFVDCDDLKIEFKYSTSYSDNIEGAKPFEGTFQFKQYIYKVELKEGYKNDFMLKKKHFQNFPKGIEFEPIVIKKR